MVTWPVDVGVSPLRKGILGLGWCDLFVRFKREGQVLLTLIWPYVIYVIESLILSFILFIQFWWGILQYSGVRMKKKNIAYGLIS